MAGSELSPEAQAYVGMGPGGAAGQPVERDRYTTQEPPGEGAPLAEVLTIAQGALTGLTGRIGELHARLEPILEPLRPTPEDVVATDRSIIDRGSSPAVREVVRILDAVAGLEAQVSRLLSRLEV